MKAFMDADFLLENETAQVLFHEYAEDMPIIDYHNHLNVKEIYEDIQYEDIAKAWLSGDHYKWRALRASGVAEKLITGTAISGAEKFHQWASIMPDLFGNPLYHWTHLELQRYFGVDTVLSCKTEQEIYDVCNAKLQEKEFSTRNLLRRMKVETLCTTDDPKDDLCYHKKLQKEFEIKVLPTFRPEQAMGIEKPTFGNYLSELGDACGIAIAAYADLKQALSKRIAYFDEAGCRISDHSLDGNIYAAATEEEAAAIFQKAVAGESVTQKEIRQYKGSILLFLGKEYQSRDWAMQIHLGALRNNSRRMLEQIGTDSGFDSVDDITYASQLSQLLDQLDYDKVLPKTVLYCLNSKDNDMLAAMAGNFQDSSIPGKVQFGAAWWFCDHKNGMEKHLENTCQTGILANFIGMLTDSRSFLSFPRHEYFRRILCNFIGQKVENGEYPPDMEVLGQMVQNICYYNAKRYFSI